MNNLGIYTTTVRVPGPFSKWVNKLGAGTLQIHTPLIYDAQLFVLKPAPMRVEGAILHNGNEWLIDFKRCLDYEMFRLEIACHMESDWLRRLVHARSSPEPLSEATKYHLSAELTDPGSLKRGFKGGLDVEDFPVTARVQIENEINTSLPTLKGFAKLRSVESEIMSDYDPHHAIKMISLQRERHRLRKQLMQEPMQTLRELMIFLTPTHFLSYLKSEEDFRIHLCEWGEELLKLLGAMDLPKAMKVVSRTDLTLERPASKGTLTFESGKFSSDLKNIIKRQ